MGGGTGLLSAGNDSEARQGIRQDRGQYGVFSQRPWRGSFDSVIRALSPSWSEGAQTTRGKDVQALGSTSKGPGVDRAQFAGKKKG